MARRIVVIGNGFDLAHNLPTRYSDFLNFIDLLPKLIDIHKEKSKIKMNNQQEVNVPERIECDIGMAEQLYAYILNVIGNDNDLDKLFEFLSNTKILENSFIKVFIWALKYKGRCDGWIDLESEIKLYIDIINNISKREYNSDKLGYNMPWLYQGASKYADYQKNGYYLKSTKTQ